MNDAQKSQLVEAAIAATRHAYIPYSNYPVGAALLTEDGALYTGCNIENAAYSPTICAERTAFAKAISEGERRFRSIAVVTRDAGSPCGVCRQFMNEFAPDMEVILADLNGEIHDVLTVRELLPRGFDSGSLKA